MAETIGHMAVQCSPLPTQIAMQPMRRPSSLMMRSSANYPTKRRMVDFRTTAAERLQEAIDTCPVNCIHWVHS